MGTLTMPEDDCLDEVFRLKRDFDGRITDQTRKAIQTLKAEIPLEEQNRARRTFLCDEVIPELVVKVWERMSGYEAALLRDHIPNRLFLGERLRYYQKQLIKALRELRLLDTAGEPDSGITPAMIEKARDFPYEDLIEVKRGMAVCPFHEDRDPSFSVKDNRGHCFGCGWKGDTIAFVMQQDGLSFPEAVKRLS